MAECQKGCGSCCDPVFLSWDPARLAGWRSEKIAATIAAGNDPATDTGWAAWLARAIELVGGPVFDTPEWRADIIKQCQPGSVRQRNADFITEHWTVIGEKDHDDGGKSWALRCDAFDPHTRTCTAHDTRPPICRDYPHYGQELVAGGNADGLIPGCSFNAEARTALPLVAINGRPA